jgi:hypothetical protein
LDYSRSLLSDRLLAGKRLRYEVDPFLGKCKCNVPGASICELTKIAVVAVGKVEG